ncbi:hypothetical protein [Microbacterium sp. MYb62]|uniref:hypothetical protein n=1 Tax=Microbacterium sp. MYb62 TaxID=1848690 RepID=UPI000CFD6048|nr:hypothetical protein [Microbacterium sp. MYb62]PRB12512.1 hypothetical protein CQ042_14905 [Microbacterium sp. MYb62]
MDKPLTTLATDLGPIDPYWTIAELIEWLSDDSRQHDPALQFPLALIESALTGEQWSRTPSTVALIRSLTLAAPHRPDSVIADVLLPVAVPAAHLVSGRPKPRAEGKPQRQVA